MLFVAVDIERGGHEGEPEEGRDARPHGTKSTQSSHRGSRLLLFEQTPEDVPRQPGGSAFSSVREERLPTQLEDDSPIHQSRDCVAIGGADRRAAEL